jgi:hypothetical protein
MALFHSGRPGSTVVTRDLAHLPSGGTESARRGVPAFLNAAGGDRGRDNRGSSCGHASSGCGVVGIRSGWDTESSGCGVRRHGQRPYPCPITPAQQAFSGPSPPGVPRWAGVGRSRGPRAQARATGIPTAVPTVVATRPTSLRADAALSPAVGRAGADRCPSDPMNRRNSGGCSLRHSVISGSLLRVRPFLAGHRRARFNGALRRSPAGLLPRARDRGGPGRAGVPAGEV